jgi:hypothetical protein
VSPKHDFGTIRSSFWHSIDERVEKRAGDVIDRALRNYRPLGLANLIIGIGSPGSLLTASAIDEWAAIEVPFPCAPEWITITGYPSGTATIDLLVARPTQLLAEAVSCVGVILPPYLSGRETKTLKQIDWNQVFEAGSRILVYVISASLVETMTINIVVRCL